MGKIRYYCEYCDRSFLDDLKARKKHLTGTQHARMRKQYYLPFRRAKEVYEEEKIKEPCRKHLMMNMCPFGESCKYSHFSPFDLERLRHQVEEENGLSSSSLSVESVNRALVKMPSEEKFQDWLATWRTKQEEEAVKPSKPAVQAVSEALSTDLPFKLKEWTDLPPSLTPLKFFNLQNIFVEDWG